MSRIVQKHFDTILIFYIKRKEAISIIRVLHTKRDIENLL